LPILQDKDPVEEHHKVPTKLKKLGDCPRVFWQDKDPVEEHHKVPAKLKKLGDCPNAVKDF
jgi:hypothetical protein